MTLEDRFHEKYEIVEPGGCWIWTGTVDGNGYGRIKVSGRRKGAHRVSWEIHNGPIPKGNGHHGTCVLHHCDVTLCVNPAHLFLGSNADNVHDSMGKGRHSCQTHSENLFSSALSKKIKRKHGEKHHYAKLTDREVVAIRILCVEMSVPEISEIFNITPKYIRSIIKGRARQLL